MSHDSEENLVLVGLCDIFGCAIVFLPACISADKDSGGYYTFDDKVYVTLNKKSAAAPSTQLNQYTFARSAPGLSLLGE